MRKNSFVNAANIAKMLLRALLSANSAFFVGGFTVKKACFVNEQDAYFV